MIELRFALNDRLRQAVYRLRQKVEQADAWPDTRQVVALHRGRVVATARLRFADAGPPGVLAPPAGAAICDGLVLGELGERPGMVDLLVKTVLREARERGAEGLWFDDAGPVSKIISTWPHRRQGGWIYASATMAPESLSESGWRPLVRNPVRQVLPRGARLYEADELANAAYQVVRGSVRLERVDANGRVHSLGMAGPGTLLGTAAARPGGRHRERAIIDADEADVERVDAAQLQAALRSDPDLAERLQGALLDRLDSLLRHPAEAPDHTECEQVEAVLRDRLASSLGPVSLEWLREHTGLSEIRLENVVSQISGYKIVGGAVHSELNGWRAA